MHPEISAQAEAGATSSGGTRDHGREPELFLGKKIFRNTFYDQLNNLQYPSISAPLSFVGAGYNGLFLVSRNYMYFGHCAFLYVVPQKIKIDTSLSAYITGFMFSVSVIGWDLLGAEKKLALIVSCGLNAGRLRLIGNQQIKQKNPFVAPMIAFSPGIKFKKIKLALNFQYDLDLSGTGWRRMLIKKGELYPVKPFNQSGLSTFLCVIYYLSR
jgi:hypothetical protein